MNQSQTASQIDRPEQHPQDDGNEPRRAARLSAAGPSLEYGDLGGFDWGAAVDDIVGSASGTGSATAATAATTAPSATSADLRAFSAGGIGNGLIGSPRDYWPTAADADGLRLEMEDDEDDDDPMEPLPFDAPAASSSAGGDAAFGFARRNYMEGIRAWSAGGLFGSSPAPGTANVGGPAAAVVSPAPILPSAAAGDGPPGMVRSSSGSLSSETDASSAASDDDSSASASSSPSKGVTFNEQVRVLPIPPLSSYSPEQRLRMYANRFELRENKTRNKKEYEFDGYDWRNATEEGSMAICPVSGELLHPAHL